MKNILELLEKSANTHPHKIAFIDEHNDICYDQLLSVAKRMASGICRSKCVNRPIAIFIDKSIECIASMLGVVYSGNFYVVIDTEMPADRISLLCDTLKPIMAITNHNSTSFPKGICNCVEFNDLIECDVDEKTLINIRAKMIDMDPVYALFTSGSTGNPKGAIVCHRSVIAYTQWFTDAFGINENTIFGNQTPLYFSMSVSDIYSTIQNSATLVLIPKSYFSFPAKLLTAMQKYEINTIYWVPSALGIVANWKALDFIQLPAIKKVLFAGEVMPVKYLNYWRQHFPEALFANLFGPTEVTDICTYYIVNRAFSNSENLPIGKPCDNCGVMVITENGKETAEGETGELCVRGSFLAHGYYNNSEKTREVFIQNPLNTEYPEIVYATGDLVRYNGFGELEYVGRKDFQIKHMGYRIELGEIEAAAYAADGLTSACCLYDSYEDEIILIYEGLNIRKDSLGDVLKAKLPHYMYPNKLIWINSMPHNANGKIDRTWLKNNYCNLENDERL